jgi:hypothetical protein
MAARTLLGLTAAVLALTLTAPAALAAQPKVTVLGEDDAVLAIFKTAKCKKGRTTKAGTNFFADAVSTNGRYELTVDIFLGFTGFHKYDLTLDPEANPVLRFSEKGEYQSGGYSNEFVPPFPVPGFGQIKFSSNGKRMGVGFGPAMWSRDASSAVVVAGGLECRYAKKKR